jgi:hypothetical protein
MMADTEPAPPTPAANRNQRIAWLMVVARLPRDPRFQRAVIMLTIGAAALVSLARNNAAASRARLAAWDKRQQIRHLQTAQRKAKPDASEG